MDTSTRQKLESISYNFFHNLLESQKPGIEEMYQAFKTRLMLELKVSGGSMEGVVYGDLEER